MKTNFLKRSHRVNIISLLIVLLLTLISAKPSLYALAAEENASNAKKTSVTHDIAIVFDNSLSMYENTDRWSQALYAIGVFASMLDYDTGDKLGIYPMGEISVGKGGSPVSDRLEITKDNIQDISKIYCSHTSPTIMKPAYTARDYLKESSLDEKWLIIMTDGAFYFDDSTSEPEAEKDGKWLNGIMPKLAVNGIKVQYLGFGEAKKVNNNSSARIYGTNVESADLLAPTLVDICNMIFQRHKVQNISDGAFDIDVSMNSIVAFAQGKSAEIKSLTDTGGNRIDAAIDEKINAGSEGTGSYQNAPIADVAGQVVTFAPCEAGNYKLDYTGSNVEVFYEPNVTIKTSLKDSAGKEYDGSEEINTGEYTVHYELVDGVTGKDVQKSNLLAPVSFNAVVSNNGQDKPVGNGDAITLAPDEKTEIKVTASYLGEYEVTNENNANGFEFNVVAPEKQELNVKLSTEQNNGWFKLDDHDNWNAIRADVTLDGKKLSDEELAKVKFELDPQPSEDFPYSCRVIPGESAYEIKLGDKNGAYAEPKCDTYHLNATAQMKDEFGRDLESKDSLRLTVEWYDEFWRWLLWLLILAILTLIIITILNLPAWPAKIVCEIQMPSNAKGTYPVTKRSNCTLVPYKWSLNATIKKNSKMWNKLIRKGGSIKVVDVSVDRHVDSYSFGAQTYNRNEKFKPTVIAGSKTITMNFNMGDELKAVIKIK